MLQLVVRYPFAIAAALIALTLLPSAGTAQDPVAPYDGSIPFACTLQQLGTGTDFPEPNADPFCVEYDKTHQNVAQGGVVDFLTKEPARVAVAGPKCFYYQRDHWTGSIPEGQAPETYHFDGAYFFDKARGLGGVHIENFRIAGQTADPTTLPGFPDAYRPYFGKGGGGVQSTGSVPLDPNCAAKPNPSGPGAGSGGQAGAHPNVKCRQAGGRITRGIGGIVLGDRRRNVARKMSAPETERARSQQWCFDGGGKLFAVYSKQGGAELLLTTAPPFDTRGIRTGSSAAKARSLRGRRALTRSVLRIPECRRRKTGRVLYAGMARGRVSFLAVSSCSLSRRAAIRDLRGAR
ncbi:MAG: hypothetical protein ACXVFN_09965 [Solirubrobacteraceae bacterium]